MIQFSVSGTNSFQSTTGSVKANLYNCAVTTSSSKKVVDMTKSGYVTIAEKSLPIAKQFYTSMSFYIDKSAGSSETLLTFSKIPLKITQIGRAHV